MPQALKLDLYDDYQKIQRNFRNYNRLLDTLKCIEDHQASLKQALHTDLSTEQFELALNHIINLNYMHQKIQIRQYQKQLIQTLIKSRNHNDGPHFIINYCEPIRDDLLALNDKFYEDEALIEGANLLKHQIKNHVVLTKAKNPQPSNLAIYRMLDGFEILINQQVLHSSSASLNKLTPKFLQRKINQIIKENNGVNQSKRNFEARCKIQILKWLKNIKMITKSFELNYDNQYQNLVADIRPNIILQPNLQIKG